MPETKTTTLTPKGPRNRCSHRKCTRH